MELYKKLTTTFILLFIASITVGFSLKGAIPYATLVSIHYICDTIFTK